MPKPPAPTPPADCRRPALAARPLMSPVEAGALASAFKVLANDTRLRLLHALLKSGELNVTDLAATLGMSAQAVSNQLTRLAALGIVEARRDGNSVFYRVIDRCVSGLLDQGWCLADEVRGGGRRGC